MFFGFCHSGKERESPQVTIVGIKVTRKRIGLFITNVNAQRVMMNELVF